MSRHRNGRRWRACALGLVGWLGLGVVAACGASPAKELLKEPELEGFAKCKVAASQMRPLIVEWKSLDRSDLESLAKQHLVAVNYIGCDMKVLYGCRIPGDYSFQGATRQSDTIRMADEDSLYANIPLHAAEFEATLKSAGQLTVSMTTVGRLSSAQRQFDASDLGAGCEDATHVVTGVTVGAFEFFSGADAEVGAGVKVGEAGFDGRSLAQRQTLSTAGVTDNCADAREDDSSPPSGCGAFIRLEVTPVAGRQPAPAPVASNDIGGDDDEGEVEPGWGDLDEDGIRDAEDACPNEPGGMNGRYPGCPSEVCEEPLDDRDYRSCDDQRDCCGDEVCGCNYLAQTDVTRGSWLAQDAGPSCHCQEEICDGGDARPARRCDSDRDCCSDESCDCGASGALPPEARFLLADAAEAICQCR